jgi:hypothetical protein
MPKFAAPECRSAANAFTLRSGAARTCLFDVAVRVSARRARLEHTDLPQTVASTPRIGVTARHNRCGQRDQNRCYPSAAPRDTMVIRHGKKLVMPELPPRKDHGGG